MKKVVIFGAGQIAEVFHFYLKNDSAYNVVAFTVDPEYVQSDTFCALPVVPFDHIEKAFPPDSHEIFIAVSYKKVNRVRAEKFFAAESKGYRFGTYVSSKATVWSDARLGRNVFVMEDNTIQPFVEVGDNVIMWSGNHVGHHAKIGSHCFIASHAVISGAVEVGDYTFIGVNATIRDNVKVGKRCVIGAGALILESTQDLEVYMGERTRPSGVPSNRLRGI